MRWIPGFLLGVMAATLVFSMSTFQSSAEPPKNRPKCSTCDGNGRYRCPSCSGNGRVSGKACSTCSGTGTAKCYTCGGTGKRLILEDLIPAEKHTSCGISKLTMAEQDALGTEVFRLYYDPWATSARAYLENEGWKPATVTKLLKNGMLVKTQYGQELQLEDSLPLLGVSEGQAVWLERTFGLTDVIGRYGKKGSYSVE